VIVVDGGTRPFGRRHRMVEKVKARHRVQVIAAMS